MIISRTPFRISLFGGGTDYKEWFKEHGGAVIGGTIDKYCYISVRHLPPYFPHKSRIVYASEEWVNYHSDIKHPSVRECLRHLGVKDGVEICHQSDLLARKGLGASSAFTVGLLNALGTLTHRGLRKSELAMMAIYVEQELIKENVGCQDQHLVALGGFNHLEFVNNGPPIRTEIAIPPDLQANLMLFDTGTSRIASEIAGEQIKLIPKRENELREMQSLTDIASFFFFCDNLIEDLGRIMHENWLIKKSLSDKISTPLIDSIYEKARQAGAIGGKILGAGGGGYMLFFVPPERHESVKEALQLRHIPFEFEHSGTQIIFNDEDK